MNILNRKTRQVTVLKNEKTERRNLNRKTLLESTNLKKDMSEKEQYETSEKDKFEIGQL